MKKMIREYKIEDTDALVSIWREASEVAHPFLPADFIEQEADNLRNVYLPHAQTWVIEENNKPVGFIAMIENEIGGLFLNPSCHGKGFGKSMVDYVVKLKGALRVDVFEKNTIGRWFYQRYGFEEIERYKHKPSGEVTLKCIYILKIVNGLVVK